MEEKQNRLKSWALWLSIVALVAFVIKKATGYDLAPVFDEFMELLLPVLVGFGIVNNPTDKYHL